MHIYRAINYGVVVIVSFSRGLMVERKRRRRAKPEHLCCGIGAGWLGGGGEKRTDRDEGGGILAPFTLSGNGLMFVAELKIDQLSKHIGHRRDLDIFRNTAYASSAIF